MMFFDEGTDTRSQSDDLEMSSISREKRIKLFFSKDLQFDDVQILLDLMGWAITRYLDVGEYSYVHLWRLFMVPFLGEQYSPSSLKIKSLFCQLSVCYVRKIQNHCARHFHTKAPSA